MITIKLKIGNGDVRLSIEEKGKSTRKDGIIAAASHMAIRMVMESMEDPTIPENLHFINFINRKMDKEVDKLN